MGFFEKLTGKLNADTPLSVVIKQRYGNKQISPQMELVDRLQVVASQLSVDQIRRFEAGTKEYDWQSPGQREAFEAKMQEYLHKGSQYLINKKII